ncbi:MAG: hypothetical protein ACKO43_01195 [Alphaproteobacteria bacterium]
MFTLHLPDHLGRRLSDLAVQHHCDPSAYLAKIIETVLEDAADYSLGMERLSEGGPRYTLQQVLNDNP